MPSLSTPTFSLLPLPFFNAKMLAKGQGTPCSASPLGGAPCRFLLVRRIFRFWVSLGMPCRPDSSHPFERVSLLSAGIGSPPPPRFLLCVLFFFFFVSPGTQSNGSWLLSRRYFQFPPLQGFFFFFYSAHLLFGLWALPLRESVVDFACPPTPPFAPLLQSVM